MTPRERFHRWLFRRAVRHIVEGPPLRRGTRPLIALSMVHRRDVLPWLLAMKTFAAHAGPERIVVVADPSLGPDERQTMLRHVPHAEIIEAAAGHPPDLPRGGTWERLAAIARLSSEAFVVQVDADTLTIARPDAVIEAVDAGRCFILRSDAGTEIEPLDAASAFGRHLMESSDHIQAVAEARFTELPDWQRWRYARGCSGFTGFARGALDLERLRAVSFSLSCIHGRRWCEWGTEQVTSNLMAASSPGAQMLPHPDYCNADSLAPTTRVVHFIGYARYVDRSYERLARHAIQSLALGGLEAQ